MRKSLTFVHGRRIEGDVTPTARFIMGDEGNSFFVFLIRIRGQWYFKGEDILMEEEVEFLWNGGGLKRWGFLKNFCGIFFECTRGCMGVYMKES